MIYVSLALAVFVGLAAIYLMGKAYARNEEAEKRLNDAIGQAQESADTPLTPFDFSNKLRERIKRKSKT